MLRVLKFLFVGLLIVSATRVFAVSAEGAGAIIDGWAAGATALAVPSSAGGIMVIGTPQTLWSWSQSTKCGGGDDFPDVPAQPFLVGRRYCGSPRLLQGMNAD